MINKITLTLIAAACMVASGAQAQMKLIARSVNDYQGGNNTTRDSVIYFYSGNRGITPEYINMPEYKSGADSIHTYTLDGTAMKLSKREVFYRTSTRIDSVLEYELDNGSWKAEGRIVINVVAGKPDTVQYQNWSNQWKSFTTSGYLVYTWSGNNATSVTRIRRTWDNKDKKWELSPDWKKTMTYDGNKRVLDSIYQDYSGGNFVNEHKTTYTYTTGGIATIEVSDPDGSTNWKATNKSLYTYNTNGIELIKSELYNGTAWEGDDSISYFYTGASKTPDSFLHYQMQFNLFSPVAKHVINANTAGQWTSDRTESWNGKPAPDGAFEYGGADSTINWYWGWNVGIDEVNADNKNLLSIYPTPASNNITIELNDGMKNKDVMFSIIDMQGRTLRNWTENYQSAKTISVAELPAGNYILHARNGNAIVAERFILSK